MTERVELDGLDLSALLCSRVCHDIISPVGAIINGLEVLDEDNSADMREFAFGLIRRSAGQASAKDGADAIAAAWEKITDQLGRDNQIKLYKASLGM